MRTFRPPVFAFMLALMVVSFGTASAQPATEGQQDCDPSLAATEGCEILGEFFTFVGPAGEQVAIYCVDFYVEYSVRLGSSGEIHFAGAPPVIGCGPSIFDVLPTGYRLVLNTSPTDGWTIHPFLPEISQCLDGTMVSVWIDDEGEPDFAYNDNAIGCAA